MEFQRWKTRNRTYDAMIEWINSYVDNFIGAAAPGSPRQGVPSAPGGAPVPTFDPTQIMNEIGQQ